MAVLQSIRDKTILVLVMIGGAMAAFILTDLINSGGSSFSSEDNIIGSIADIEISPSDFQEELFFIQNSSQFRSYSEGQQISIAWDKLVQDRLIDMVSILIGSDVTALEIGELQTGAINEVNRDNVFSSFFGIPEMNDVSIIQDFIDDINYQGQKYRVEDKQQFLILEEEVIKQRYTQKYQDLIEKGMYTTSIEARNIFSSRTQNAKVRYVSIPYSSVSQDIDVTDEEIKEFYAENISDYYNDEEKRSLEYVTFTVTPSTQDDEQTKKNLASLYSKFADADNDESFSRRYSTSPLQYFEYLRSEQALSQDSIFAKLILQGEGSVLGPYKVDGDTYRLSKLSETTLRPDKVEFSQILISSSTIQDIGDSTAQARMNDWKKRVEDGEDFGLLASQVSEGSEKSNFGYFGEISESDQLFSNSDESNRLFMSKCFESQEGDLHIVRTVDGYHLLNITKLIDIQQKYKIVYVDQDILATDSTKDTYFSQAIDFSNLALSSDSSFKYLAESQNYSYNEMIDIDNMRFNIANLEDSRKVVRWMFGWEGIPGELTEREVGDIKDFQCGNQYVVVRLSSVSLEGEKPLDIVKEDIVQKIEKRKRFDVISGQLSNISLEEAADLFSLDIDTIDKVNFANSNISIGNQLHFVGTASSSSISSTSSPVEGLNSVFVLSVISRGDDINEVEDAQRIEIQRSNSQGRFFSSVMNILKKNANISENRIKYY